MPFEAHYPGFCENCEDRFAEGDLIEGDPRGYRHADCDPKPERKTETCLTCWLIKPCDCEEE